MPNLVKKLVHCYNYPKCKIKVPVIVEAGTKIPPKVCYHCCEFGAPGQRLHLGTTKEEWKKPILRKPIPYLQLSPDGEEAKQLLERERKRRESRENLKKNFSENRQHENPNS